jgi:hypothetical protein
VTTSPGAVMSGHPFRLSSRTQPLVRDGLIRNLLADVFVAHDVPDSPRLRAMAAGLLIPAHRQRERSWVVGFTSAAWVYTGLLVPPGVLPGAAPAGPAEPSQLEVIIMSGSSRPADPWIRNRQSRLARTEIGLMHGVPVSDPIRTAADVARDLPAGPALELLARLGELEQITAHQVLHRLGAMRYSRGAARAKATVQQWQERERWLQRP